jgi:hypothetical protein
MGKKEAIKKTSKSDSNNSETLNQKLEDAKNDKNYSMPSIIKNEFMTLLVKLNDEIDLILEDKKNPESTFIEAKNYYISIASMNDNLKTTMDKMLGVFTELHQNFINSQLNNSNNCNIEKKVKDDTDQQKIKKKEKVKKDDVKKSEQISDSESESEGEKDNRDENNNEDKKEKEKKKDSKKVTKEVKKEVKKKTTNDDTKKTKTTKSSKEAKSDESDNSSSESEDEKTKPSGKKGGKK